LEEGEEDNAELIDEVCFNPELLLRIIDVFYPVKATKHDRAWDDWKEANPRGWGNKLGKKF